MHLAQKPSIEIVDFDAMYHNLDSHQHYNLSIGHARSSASPEDRFDKHILIESVSENLAMTSRIFHLLTAKHIQNIKKQSCHALVHIKSHMITMLRIRDHTFDLCFSL